jgi:hypothetical protein
MNEERDQSLVMRSEVQGPQGRGRVVALLGVSLVLKRAGR